MDNGGGGGDVTPEMVFRDFHARKQGLLKAFTTEMDKFYQMCSPEKENLGLYGYPDETWEVSLPDELPPSLPEPAFGINFARDGMNAKDWLSLVAAHTDSWLLSVAFYCGARHGLDKKSRKQLFSMINSVPTLFEVFMGTDKRQPKEETRKHGSKSKKTASKRARQLEPNPRNSKIPEDEEESEWEEVSEWEEEKVKEDHKSMMSDSCGEHSGQEAGPGIVRITPKLVFWDFRGRQQGLLKAFTTEVYRFYHMCDPEKDNLWLYGFPNETWEVDLPFEMVPPEIPEPALGLNFVRDAMDAKEWLSYVARNTDSWLLSVAFYFATRGDFDKESRKRLFNMINSVPTLLEFVMGTDKRQPKEKTKSRKSASKQAQKLEPNPRSSKIPLPEEQEVSEWEESEWK